MIREEKCKVTVGGVVIRPANVRVTAGVGKGYNTATISGIDDDEPIPAMQGSVGDTVAIAFNGETFTFIINEKHYSKNRFVTFDCVGLPATLEDGRPSVNDLAFATSDELIADAAGTVPYINNIPTIDFNGQTYSKLSTPMSRILDMVTVIEGEAYEVDNHLVLDPLLGITGTRPIAHTYADGEDIEFAYSEKRSSTLKTKSVLINPAIDDIYSETSITFDYNEETKMGEILFNPSLTSGIGYTIEGITAKPPLQTEQTETISIDGADFVNTIAGIDSVRAITIDGTPINPADYVLYPTHNVIRFISEQTGEVQVTYTTKSITAYVTSSTRFKITYDCAVINDHIYVGTNTKMRAGACSANIKTPITYEDGAVVTLSLGQDASFVFVEARGATHMVTEKTYTLSGGGTLTVKYLYESVDWVDKGFMNAITSVSETITDTTTGTVAYDDDLSTWVVQLAYPLKTIHDIYFGNQILSGYTYHDDPITPYIEFLEADNGKTVEISYDLTQVVVTVPPPGNPHPVTYLDVVACAGVISAEFQAGEDTLCSLPATFDISVSDSFRDLTVNDVVGKTLTGDFGSLIVDNRGKVTVTVSTQGSFEILCDSIRAGAIITVNSEGVI